MDAKKEIPKSYHILFIIYYIINFLMFLGFTVFIMFLFIDPYLLKGKNVNKYRNDYCKNESNINHDLIYTNTYFNYKKSKFIWISIDGLATDQLVELHNFEKYKITTSFLNMGKYNKYTNMLYEAMMTGKYNKNLIGKEMKYDNFINQLIQANYNISFIGWKVPIVALAGEDLSKKFYKKSIDDNHEILAFNSFCNMTNLFPFLNVDFINYQKTDPHNKIDKNLEKKIIELIDEVRDDDYYLLKNISKDIFFEELDEIFSEVPDIFLELNITDCLIKNFNWNNEDNFSIIYYSTEVDEFNHFYGKNHIYSLLNSYIVEKMIINIMKWIDEHPDYALIFNSDHGGQHFYGEDTIRNHGEDFPGNEGIFYIYTKEFRVNYNKLKMKERYINIIDENVLMSEILLNVNIPLESEGIPYNLINDQKFGYSSLKMKEAQLIQLLKIYDPDKKNGNFNKILKELNESFDKIEEVKSKYFNDDGINSNEKLKVINKNNLDRLINLQNKINEIIEKDYNTKTNVVITIVIIIVVIIKAFFECYFILEFLINKYFNIYSHFQKFLFIFFFVFYLYIIELVFLFFSNTSKNLQFLVQLYIFISCIILLIIKIIISNLNISNLKIENKIYYYFLMIFGFLFFQVFSEYSYCYNTIKSFFSKHKPQLLLNIFFLYPLLIIFTIHEIKKYNFKNKNQKGEYVFIYIIMINIIFIISIFMEDMSYQTYYYQNTLNLTSMYIAFIIYIIYFFSCFIINSFDLINEKLLSINISKRIEINYNNNSNIVPIKLVEKMGKNVDSKELSFNIINKMLENNKKFNDSNLENAKENKNSSYLYYYNNFVYLKLCIVQGSFWLSDESEKIFIFLSLIIFEFTEYINNYLYINIFNMKSDKKNLDLTIIEDNKTINDKNISLLSFIFYIIIQKTLISMNQLLFLLIIHSYDFNSSKQQKQKFIKFISSFLPNMATFIANYKFSFIIIGYFLEKNFITKKDNRNTIEFSIYFMIKRIIINLRLNDSVILLIFHSLINIKEEESLEFYSYYLVDFILFAFDYLCVIFSIIIALFKNIFLCIYS